MKGNCRGRFRDVLSWQVSGEPRYISVGRTDLRPKIRTRDFPYSEEEGYRAGREIPFQHSEENSSEPLNNPHARQLNLLTILALQELRHKATDRYVLAVSKAHQE
jgi:hypothetical protein